MLGAGIASLIDTGANMAGGLIGNILAGHRISAQREANYQMTDYLYAKDLENWNRVNQYNSPANQMARFREAGLNPALMYDKGTPGIASPPPPTKESNSPSYPHPDIPIVNPVAQYQDYRVKQAQIDVAESVAQKNLEDVKLKGIQIALGNMDKELKPATIRYLMDEYTQHRKEWPYDLQARSIGIEKTRKEIDQIATQMNLNAAQTEKLARWLQSWDQDHINIDHAPWYVPPVVGGLKEIPEQFKKREGLYPWETVPSGK